MGGGVSRWQSIIAFGFAVWRVDAGARNWRDLESQILQIDDIPVARAPTLCACCASMVNRQTWVTLSRRS